MTAELSTKFADAEQGTMGWEIHITRRADWDSDVKPISVVEWMSLVSADPDLMIDPRNNGPYFALWTAHDVENDHPWFDWSGGEINTKHPDKKTLGKAIEIARHFDAIVMGDDGEVYERPEDLHRLPAQQKYLRSTAARPWWKFW